ncbi:MAG: NERD domain-containing protein [Verrucomicrobiia bacterium]
MIAPPTQLTHRTKPWAEIDFVVVGPPGVFCLEVKGGRIARKDGRYYYTDRHGNTQSRKRGPFEQVAPAAAALRQYLVAKLPRTRNTAVGYGVLTPDIHFDITGPDIEPKVIYDNRDGARRFAAYMRRLADYWHERLEGQSGRPLESLSPSHTQAIFDELRADFDLRPSLRTRVGLVKDELLSLTKEQYRILDALQDNERALVRGGAGTGKTLLAIEEALRQAATGRRVFLCCFNKNLAVFLRNAVRSTPIDVCHLHSFMASAVQEAGLAGRLPPAEEDDLFTVFYPELCAEALLALDRFQTYDALIIDEGQDLLRQNYLEVFDALLKNGLDAGQWRIFLDPHQDVFGSLSSKGMQRLQQAHPAHFRLPLNCRNTKPIAVATRIISGIMAEETLKASGPEVEHVWFSSEAQQPRAIANCINRLLSDGIKPEEIAILSPYNLQNTCLANGLPGVTCPVTQFPTGTPPTPGHIQFATISSFKGLESDTVLLIDIYDLDLPESHLTLYVGATRPRAYLAVFLPESLRDSYAELVRHHAQTLMANFHSDPMQP